MEQFEKALHSLTKRICSELGTTVIPKKPIWTVVYAPDAPPHLAMDPERPALSDLFSGISMALLQLPEYDAVAEAAENTPEFREGIAIDGGGVLQMPERTNITRFLVLNFLRRYLRGGLQLDWDETRFTVTIAELKEELRQKSVLSRTVIPLSHLRMDIDTLELGDEIRLLPASTEELERWLNWDRDYPMFRSGLPRWDQFHIDRPAVLHMQRVIRGRSRSEDPQDALQRLPPSDNVDQVITALRLAMDLPITAIFREQRSEGLMAFLGVSTGWGNTPPGIGPVAILNQDGADHVTRILQLFSTSPNMDLLRLPLSRWQASLVRPNLEDRLIDAWISLEALLLGGKEGELSYRAALLLAEFLGTSGVQRKAIFDEMRISYRWRSAIVHAGKTKNLEKKASLQDTVRMTTSNLRSVLLKVLELPGRFNPAKLQSNLLTREDSSS